MKEEAIFAAGCFWGVESSFRSQSGVLETEVGYIGGNTASPTYEQVCKGTTRHAEAVRIEFDNEKISYRDLLTLFWEIHDPTTMNRQGPDIGTQYRSAIFCLNSSQLEQAKTYMMALEEDGIYPAPIVTLIQMAQTFYKAEEYHQQYHDKNGRLKCR